MRVQRLGNPVRFRRPAHWLSREITAAGAFLLECS
jgi:hypothetical protein